MTSALVIAISLRICAAQLRWGRSQYLRSRFYLGLQELITMCSIAEDVDITNQSYQVFASGA